MKQIIRYFAFCALFLATGTFVFAQTKAEMKAIKKEVKGMKKEGWKVNPGYLTLEEQVYESKKYLKDQEHWITGEAKSRGTVYDAVRSNAIMAAKVELARKVDEEVIGKSNIGGGNDQSNTLTSASRYRDEARTKFAAQIQRPKVLMDCFQSEKDGSVVVLIRLAISHDESVASYKKMMQELKELMLNK